MTIIKLTITAARDSGIWAEVSETGNQVSVPRPGTVDWVRTEADVFPLPAEASEQDVIERLRRADPSAVIVLHGSRKEG